MSARPDADPMHDVVAGERESLLSSGVVAGGEELRRGMVGSGTGASPSAASADVERMLSIKRAGARALVGELDEAEELEGVGDAYDAAEGILAVKRKVAKRQAEKQASAEPGPATPDGKAVASKPADAKGAKTVPGAKDAASEQAELVRARKANGAAGSAKSATAAASAQAGPAAEMSAQAAGAKAARAAGQAASAAAGAEGTTTAAGAIAGAAAPIAGVVAGIVVFVMAALAVGQIVSALFGFWENEQSRLSMEGLPSYITYEMVEAALDAQDKYGHPAGCTIAQIICESGQGDHMSRLATRDHNLFGMKWASSYGAAPEVAGKASWATGEEAADGSHYTITAQFIRFKGDAECIAFRSRVFLQASRYAGNALIKEAIRNHDSDKMAEGLKDAGWATDSSYVTTLKSIMATYDLYRFDGLSLEDFKASKSASGNVIVAAAYSQLGVPYVWGGSTPGKALDCSGLTQYCYRQAGIKISHYTGDQYNELTRIPLSQAQPGDILYKPGHVAIYIGDDKYIHEPHTGAVCRIGTGKSYFTCALTARS